jgi:AraC-like DNA-binding protein
MSGRRSKPAPREATVRVGGALAITTLLRDFGLDPDEVLREAGIDPALFTDPDNLITYRARGRLFTRCVARTGCQHFGLLTGQLMNLQSLGLVGLLVRNSPDVATALRSLVTFLHLHSRGAVMELQAEGALAMLTYDAYQPNAGANDQTGDGAVAMMLNVMRTLCGPGFQPIEVRFAHRKPANVRPFSRFFQVPLRFDAEHNALVFSSDWLGARLPGTDAELQRLLQKQTDALEAKHHDEFPEQVRSVLRSALLTGHASADQVAALFSMHSRTLSRRLEAFGTGFQELVDEGRFEIARQMLEDTSLDVGQIAAALGYARASVFTRAFRRWSRTTPTAWRARRARRA